MPERKQVVEDLAFALYAQQRCGGLGPEPPDIERARPFWSGEDADQLAMWRSKASGVLFVLELERVS